MTVDIDIWDFENYEVVECIITRIENDDLKESEINDIENALKNLKQSEAFFPTDTRDFDDFVYQMERGDFEKLFELMNNSWQNS